MKLAVSSCALKNTKVVSGGYFIFATFSAIADSSTLPRMLLVTCTTCDLSFSVIESQEEEEGAKRAWG